MKGRKVVIGIPDFWTWSAYLLCILSAVACVVYGLLNWNCDGENEVEQIKEKNKWEKFVYASNKKYDMDKVHVEKCFEGI